MLVGLTHLLHGLGPRPALLGWFGLAFSVVVLFFGPVLRIPDWIQSLSPFHHLALVPAEDFRWAPLVVLAAVAVALSGAGWLVFRRRDVEVR